MIEAHQLKMLPMSEIMSNTGRGLETSRKKSNIRSIKCGTCSFIIDLLKIFNVYCYFMLITEMVTERGVSFFFFISINT